MPKYNVYTYPVMVVKFKNIEAESPQAALARVLNEDGVEADYDRLFDKLDLSPDMEFTQYAEAIADAEVLPLGDAGDDTGDEHFFALSYLIVGQVAAVVNDARLDDAGKLAALRAMVEKAELANK